MNSENALFYSIGNYINELSLYPSDCSGKFYSFLDLNVLEVRILLNFIISSPIAQYHFTCVIRNFPLNRNILNSYYLLLILKEKREHCNSTLDFDSTFPILQYLEH